MPSHTNPHRTLFLGVLLFSLLIFGLSIFTDGMFFDGLAYASVSRNLAEGVGGLWQMAYTRTLMTPYYDQPPLFFLLEGSLFFILGDHLYVERWYCFLMAIAMVIAIYKMWKLVSDQDGNTSWLPVSFWAITPMVSWTYGNNLLEMTLGLMDIWAVYFLLKACMHQKWRDVLLGSLFLFLASFTKGLQGLFPLAVPLLYAICLRNQSGKILLRIFIGSLLVPMVMYVLFYCWREANSFYGHYFIRRIQNTFSGSQDTTSNRFTLLFHLAKQLLMGMVPFFLLLVFWKRKNILANQNFSMATLFLCIGLSASLPLMITLEQRPFYLTTAIPYFALSLSLCWPQLPAIIGDAIFGKRLNLVRINGVLIALIVIAILLLPLAMHVSKRDEGLIRDMYALKPVITPGTIIQAEDEMLTDWALHAYLIRYANISMDHQSHPFQLSYKNSAITGDSCRLVSPGQLNKFVLYHCE